MSNAVRISELEPAPLSAPGHSWYAELPLVVDLDGTLIRTDSLWESLVRMVRQSPRLLLMVPLWLLGGRAALKSKVAKNYQWKGTRVPWNRAFLDFLLEEHQRGRKLVLATAAHESIANAVAEELGIFSAVLASSGNNNLKGLRKLDAIRANLGPDFVYAGDSAADLPVWQAARAAILVNVPRAVRARVAPETVVEREFVAPAVGALTWIKALRMHQWTKNILIFVPVLTSYSIADTGRLANAVLAFVAFGMVASATYLINDIWDLDHDRIHRSKCNRPIASGQISIPESLLVSSVMIALGAALALAVSRLLFIVLLGYWMLTSLYSLMLKRYVVADVIALAALYTIRILAGAVAIQVVVTEWLLSFSILVFVSLALVKRCAELIPLEVEGAKHVAGRDYQVRDLRVLVPLGVSTALSSVVVFGLFVSVSAVSGRLLTPSFAWLAGISLIYWLTRLWIKTIRGEMNDDPLVFAMRDRGSLATIGTLCCLMIMAKMIHLEWQ